MYENFVHLLICLTFSITPATYSIRLKLQLRTQNKEKACFIEKENEK